MDLVPTLVDGAVVINLVESCNARQDDCGACTDLSVAVHNMLTTSELGYLVMDLQDEKIVCPLMLEEILQLHKRLRCPFIFVGVMERSLEVLESYSYATHVGVYPTPSEAISNLRQQFPELLAKEITGIEFEKPLVSSRSRAARTESEDEADAD